MDVLLHNVKHFKPTSPERRDGVESDVSGTHMRPQVMAMMVAKVQRTDAPQASAGAPHVAAATVDRVKVHTLRSLAQLPVLDALCASTTGASGGVQLNPGLQLFSLVERVRAHTCSESLEAECNPAVMQTLLFPGATPAVPYSGVDAAVQARYVASRVAVLEQLLSAEQVDPGAGALAIEEALQIGEETLRRFGSLAISNVAPAPEGTSWTDTDSVS